MQVTSAARKWAAPLYVVFVVALAAFLVWYVGNSGFAIAAIVGGGFLALSSRQLPWGYAIAGTTVSVTRPYDDKNDITFDLAEVAHAEYFSFSFVKRVNVRLDDSHRFVVVGLGTENIAPFAQAIMQAYQLKRTTPAPSAESEAVGQAMPVQSDGPLSPSRPKPSLAKSRAGGAIALIVGLALAKWQIFDALTAASRGEQHVVVSTWGLGGAVMLPLIGLFYLVAGDRATEFLHSFDDDGRLNRRGMVALAVMCVVAVGLVWLVFGSLSAQGYN